MTGKPEPLCEGSELAQHRFETLRDHPASVLALRPGRTAGWRVGRIVGSAGSFSATPSRTFSLVGDALHTRARIDIRPWPYEPTIAQLILLDVNMVPTHAAIEQWIDQAFEWSPEITSIRTGALFPAAATAFAERDFVVADRLALLELELPPTKPVQRPELQSSTIGTRRLRRSDFDVAARIDSAAFETSWQNDAQSLGQIIDATPKARARIATIDRRPIGFALTGKAGTTGYLQRIAVDPSARRLGMARHLVDDAVHWLSRRGATTALVNTGCDNAAAIALYVGRGFQRRSDQLLVMEYTR